MPFPPPPDPDQTDLAFPPPLALGPSPLGGGRGVFLTAPVPVGTVLLRDTPILSLPPESVAEEETLHVALARHAVTSPHHRDVATRIACALHPIRLADLDPDAQRHAWARLGDDVDSIVATMKLPKAPREGEEVGEDDISVDERETDEERERAREAVLLMILRMQFNAFSSGVYLRQAMINHCCTPNCAKFRRVDGSGRVWSEIVTVRDLPSGEEVTISYLDPIEQSWAAREKTFTAQHLCSVRVASEIDPIRRFEHVRRVRSRQVPSSSFLCR